MSWLLLRQSGRPAVRPDAAELPARLDAGTLVVELDLAECARAKDALLRLPPDPRARRLFTIERKADGRLHLFRRQKGGECHLSVGLGREPVRGLLRLSYHWDRLRARSLLTAENISLGTLRQQEVAEALPVLAEELASLLAPEPGAPAPHPAIDWIGVADHWQVVGPVPGLPPEAPVQTPGGPRAIAALCPGDLVRTADAGDCTVLWQGRVRVPGLGRFGAVRLCAPHFGLAGDLVLRACQPVAVAGADVEYLFGEDEVLVEAGHLVNGTTVVREGGGAVTASHGIVLDRPSLLRVGALRLESLYLGGLARAPALAAATAAGRLSEVGRMPLHGDRTRRLLRPFEATALLRSRDANLAPIAA